MAIKLSDKYKRCTICNRYTDQIVRVPIMADEIRMAPDPYDPKKMQYFLRFTNDGPTLHRCELHRITHKRITTDGVWFHVNDTMQVALKRLRERKMRIVQKLDGGKVFVVKS